MLVSQIITRVRKIAGDDAAIQFTDDTLIDWINDGIRDCAIHNNLLQKTATSATVVGQKEYALPTDILKLHSIKVDTVKIPVLTMEEFDNLVQTDDSERGTPQTSYVWAGKLVLFPIPDEAFSLRVDYIYTPAILTSADLATEPSLPVGYHSRLVDYCLAKVAEQDEDYNRYQIKMQEFLTGVQILKEQPENDQASYPSISVSPRDMGDGYYG